MMPRLRFKEGALDAIMYHHRLSTDEQLAAFLDVNVEDLPRLRAGATVTPRLALRTAMIRGDGKWTGGLFREVAPDHAHAA